MELKTQPQPLLQCSNCLSTEKTHCILKNFPNVQIRDALFTIYGFTFPFSSSKDKTNLVLCSNCNFIFSQLYQHYTHFQDLTRQNSVIYAAKVKLHNGNPECIDITTETETSAIAVQLTDSSTQVEVQDVEREEEESTVNGTFRDVMTSNDWMPHPPNLDQYTESTSLFKKYGRPKGTKNKLKIMEPITDISSAKRGTRLRKPPVIYEAEQSNKNSNKKSTNDFLHVNGNDLGVRGRGRPRKLALNPTLPAPHRHPVTESVPRIDNVFSTATATAGTPKNPLRINNLEELLKNRKLNDQVTMDLVLPNANTNTTNQNGNTSLPLLPSLSHTPPPVFISHAPRTLPVLKSKTPGPSPVIISHTPSPLSVLKSQTPSTSPVVKSYTPRQLSVLKSQTPGPTPVVKSYTPRPLSVLKYQTPGTFPVFKSNTNTPRPLSVLKSQTPRTSPVVKSNTKTPRPNPYLKSPNQTSHPPVIKANTPSVGFLKSRIQNQRQVVKVIRKKGRPFKTEGPRPPLNRRLLELECNECGKLIKGTARNLKIHIRAKHEHGPIYKCTRCPKQFTSRAGLQFHSLKPHLKPHSAKLPAATAEVPTVDKGMKRYRCNVKGCTKDFAFKSALSLHSKLHTRRREILS